MILEPGIATSVKRGYYFYQADVTSGSLGVNISINGLPPMALTDLSLTTSGYGYIALPECTLTAIVSNTAVIALEPVATDTR